MMADLTLAPDDVEAMRQHLDGVQQIDLQNWAAQFQRQGHAPQARRVRQRRGGAAAEDDSDAARARAQQQQQAEEEEEAPPPEPEEESEEMPPMRIVRRAMPPSSRRASERLGPPAGPECFFCDRAQPSNPSIAFEPIRQIATCFQGNMSYTDKVTLAIELTRTCNNEVIRKSNKNRLPGETPIEPVTKAELFRHFTRHVNEFGVRRALRLDMIDELVHETYERECWEEEEVEPESGVFGPPRPRPHGVRMLREILALEKNLYGQDPKRAMFSSAGIGLATEDVRPVIDANKRRLHTTNAARHTGTVPSNAGNGAGVSSTIAGSGITQQRR